MFCIRPIPSALANWVSCQQSIGARAVAWQNNHCDERHLVYLGAELEF